MKSALLSTSSLTTTNMCPRRLLLLGGGQPPPSCSSRGQGWRGSSSLPPFKAKNSNERLTYIPKTKPQTSHTNNVGQVRGQGAQALEGIFFLLKVLTSLRFLYPSRNGNKHLTRAGSVSRPFLAIHTSKPL